VGESRAWLLLGSNIDPAVHLAKAVEMLARRAAVEAVSSAWQSPPADGRSQPDYLNAAVLLRTGLSPEALAAGVIAPIENALGRKRTADKFAPRTIDIDLALYDDRQGIFAGGPLPHPDLLRRAYFALPLAEISPDKVHPATGETLRAIAARLQDGSIRRREDIKLGLGYRPFEPAPDGPAGCRG
jgi:2-amino-4-hydroxy-6-hydroxymethyldihydropteridine diphosphokinase